MIAGILFVVLLWVLTYGLNVPIRALQVLLHKRRYERLARFDVEVHRYKLNGKRLLIAPLAILIVFGAEGWASWSVGLLIGSLLATLLWLFYYNCKARRTETVLFDRSGVTILAHRPGLVTSGSFATRIEWKDCFGYSFFQGHLLLALHPLGHVEQKYGAYRDDYARVLEQVGLRKIKAYDLLATQEATERERLAIEDKVMGLVDSVLASYRAELEEQGYVLQAERRYEGEAEEMPYAFLHLTMHEGDEPLDELDWLLWSQEGDVVELLHLPDDRLYEALDERVQVLIDAVFRQKGQEARPAAVQ